MLRLFSVSLLIFLYFQLEAQRLSAPDFATQLKASPGAVLIDVRTPGEFQGGHLANAVNYQLNSSEFKQKTASLDKKKPVFVYCLSGARSNAAAQQLTAMGYEKVFDMSGGMIQWRNNGLPEVSGVTSKKGMTLSEYTALTTKKSLVLIDFYAEWCAPCKKMKPFLAEIDKEMASSVDVVRIDADAEKDLCKQLRVDALPVLILYKNGKEVWKHKAFISKADLVAKIKQFSNK
ncbi:MAG: redoxin domain-containing protein [Saprospiraceae bacterium]|jgi:thioredoxin 1|nr:redoxin domain-containing protein [Saprospiraceae bacterium]